MTAGSTDRRDALKELGHEGGRGEGHVSMKSEMACGGEGGGGRKGGEGGGIHGPQRRLSVMMMMWRARWG